MTTEAMTILVATKNLHKAEELSALIGKIESIAGCCLETISLADWEAGREPLAEPAEGERDFVENARLKAVYYAQATGLPAVADDSGLSVVALNGRPGVLSARFGGPGLDDQGRCRYLLDQLKGQEDRRAYFTSVLALARPDGAALFWEGRVDGLITESMRGSCGFGYDPVFFHPPSGRTMAELQAAEKNAISHRAQAAKALLNDAARVAAFLNGE